MKIVCELKQVFNVNTTFFLDLYSSQELKGVLSSEYYCNTVFGSKHPKTLSLQNHRNNQTQVSCNLENITIRLSTPPPRFRMYTSNIHLPPSVTLLIEFHEEEKSYPSYNAQTTVEFVNRVIHQFLDFWRYLLTPGVSQMQMIM